MKDLKDYQRDCSMNSKKASKRMRMKWLRWRQSQAVSWIRNQKRRKLPIHLSEHSSILNLINSKKRKKDFAKIFKPSNFSWAQRGLRITISKKNICRQMNSWRFTKLNSSKSTEIILKSKILIKYYKKMPCTSNSCIENKESRIKPY